MAIENPNTKTGFSDGRTVEEWRQQTKWKVPYYVQNKTDPEGGSGNFIPLFAKYTDKFNKVHYRGMNAGCHIYMYS